MDMGTNYSRGLLKQVEELTLENERLLCENRELKAENRELRSRLSEMEAKMEAVVTKLTGEIDRLKAQINKNSGNSSKPPSQDGFKRIPNSREKSNRKSGGQPGHPGARLELPPNLDELIENGLARRELKDHTDGRGSYVTRYTLDLDITLVVTEHRYPKGIAPRGAEVAYGDNIKSLAALLCVEGVIAQERLSKLFSEMTRGAIRLSDASIEKFLTELSGKLDGEIAHIKTSLLNGHVMNVDETPQRCGQKPDYSGDTPVLHNSEGTSFNVYIRTHSNETATLYTANPQKDKESVKRDGILPAYTGILSHDHEAKFYNYGMEHATCGAHLLRELKGLFELQKIPWAEEMRLFMSSVNDYKNADIADGITFCDPVMLAGFKSRYDFLLSQGHIALGMLKAKELGHHELRKMLNRLAEFKDNYLLFICDYRAPFTNNLAERDLRPCKTKQKVSGCFRSWAGMQTFTRIRSFISTLNKRGFHLLDSISYAFRSIPVLALAE